MLDQLSLPMRDVRERAYIVQCDICYAKSTTVTSVQECRLLHNVLKNAHIAQYCGYGRNNVLSTSLPLSFIRETDNTIEMMGHRWIDHNQLTQLIGNL